MLTLPVHRIIPFSNVEGLGNRTSIFVQGCNANCLYCHNSETIPMEYDGIMNFTLDALVELIKGNMPFIRGITVSGGEASLYPQFLTQLFKEIHKLGLTSYIDTNGFFDFQTISSLIEVTDKFLFDIKGMGPTMTKLCFSDTELKPSKKRHELGHNFSHFDRHMDNLKQLIAMDKVEEIRLVYIKDFYDPYQVIKEIADCISLHSNILFKIIKVHSRGLSKERLLLIKGHIPSNKDILELNNYAKSLNITNIVTIF
jgi:pyruvate-formate lyase-activating enzyme